MLSSKLLSYKNKMKVFLSEETDKPKIKSPTDTDSWVGVMNQPVFGESPPFSKTLHHKIEPTDS